MARTPVALAAELAQRIIFGPAPSLRSSYRQRVAFGAEGAESARRVLAEHRPVMVARFGSTELACVSFYLRWRERALLPAVYRRSVRKIAWENSGIFPTDDASLDRFCEYYLSCLSQADVLGVWFNPSEDRIVERFAPQARLVHLEALNPVLYERPWNAELAGKRVLVVHPFAATIASQYRDHRERLFANPAILPEFELTTIRAVQSIAGNTGGYASWFDALDAMQEQIAATDFDIAIIGAGAYGLPLASFVKQMGRQAVHLGGQTQLLFGIRGRRWEIESPDDIAPLFNEYWVRPSAEETPERSGAVEGGCYW